MTDTQTPQTPIAKARAVMQSGDLVAAEALVRSLGPEDARTAMAALLLAQVLFRQGKNEEALEAAQTARERKAKFAAAHMQLAQVYSNLHRPDDAFAILTEACREFPSDAALQARTAEAALTRGALDAALAAIERARTLEPDNATHRALHAALLAAAGRPAEASAQLDARDDPSTMLAPGRKLAEFLVREHRLDEALALTEWMAAAFASSAELHVWRGELFLLAGRAAEASQALASAPLSSDDALRLRHTRLAGRVAQALNDPNNQIAAWKMVLQFAPGDQEALEHLVLSSHALGRDADAKAFLINLNEARRKTLPATLAGGLAALNAMYVNPPVMDDRIRWGWELADKSRWTFDRWWARVLWGRRASNIVASWRLGAPDKVAELEALIDDPGSAVFADVAHTGCLFIGTHLGPVLAGVRYLETRGHALKTFGGNEIYGREDHLPVTKNPYETFRTLIRELRSGAWVAFGHDGQRGQIMASLAGRMIPASTFAPRLMLSAKVPCLWYQPLWRDGCIAIEIERLPDPHPGEPEGDWCRRWIAAYLALLERVMCGDPENLGLQQGVWGPRHVPKGLAAAERMNPTQASQ